MIALTPKPENDFLKFIKTYFNECHRRFPKIEAIAGKWGFEDLIPGMSDFDTRFICSDDITVDEWCTMSTVVGEVHLDMCRRFPEWIRILEHLPGVNLTWEELLDDFTYYPEYRQWSFYFCVNQAKLDRALNTLNSRLWDDRDEYFHLKKFTTYYGPYDREIDVPINLGEYLCKYPLHSRIMHYFSPPVQSAVSIILKRPIRSKVEAFRLASRMFPELKIFNEIFEILGVHYEVQQLYEEPYLSEFDKRLFAALEVVMNELRNHITLIPEENRGSVSDWKHALQKVQVAPQMLVFDNCRFSRLMKGRLCFYAAAPAYFDNIFLIQNELKRLGNNFYRVPYKTFWKIVKGESVSDPDTIINKLVPDILTEKEAAATLEFSRLMPGVWEEGKEVEIALKTCTIFDDFYRGLNKIQQELAAKIKN